MKFKYVVVGAGLSGATIAERIASQLHEEVLIIEKRKHIAGNCYDFYDEHGILVHKYGPHCFHTKNQSIWNYLSEFTDWRIYSPEALSYVSGRLIPFPPNLDTLNELFGTDWDTQKLREYYTPVARPIPKIKTSEDVILAKAGKYVYDRFFKNYSKKLWGMTPDKLDPEILERIPIRVNRDPRYYDEPYQGIPEAGYTKMVEEMLDHPNIKLMLGTDYKDIIEDIEYKKLFYTGPLDYFFDYKFGRFPYRSLYINFETYNLAYYQPAAWIFYPNDYDFTRVTEYKHITDQKSLQTTISREYPEPGEPPGEPYYPVLTEKSKKLREKYINETEKCPNVIFMGRLGEFRYYNMDQVVSNALEVFSYLNAK